MIIFVFLILFSSTIISFANSTWQYVACGGCEESKNILSNSISTIMSAGQKDVTQGVNGLVSLKTQPIELQSSLYNFYLFKICVGSFETLMYILLFMSLYGFLGKILTNYETSILISLFLAFLTVGVLSLAFGGGFYTGWFSLLANGQIFSIKAPAGNVTSVIQNATGNV